MSESPENYPEIRPNFSGSHTFPLTATATALFSFRLARRNVIHKAKRKLSLISGYSTENSTFSAIVHVVLPPSQSSLRPGWGYSTKFYTGKLRPEVQPLITLSHTIFDGKGTPFIYLVFVL